MKRKRRRVKKKIKVIGAVIFGYVLLYFTVSMYYQDKWYPNTSINGINVSNMTYTESKKLFDKTIKNYTLEIVGKDDISFKINGKDIDLLVDFKSNLEKDFSSHKNNRSIFSIFSNHDHEINLKVSYDQDRVDKLINESILITGSEAYQIKKSVSAHVEYNNETKSGKIVDEIEGNELD